MHNLVLMFLFVTSFLSCTNYANAQDDVQKFKISDFKYNVYSQYGEDGIIETIFNVIGTKSKRCIEFGAWDGFFLANTANLFANKNWEAILIECDTIKFNDLIKNVSKYNCKCICDTVGIGNNSLESILNRNSISLDDIDLLSIDIDGNDYYIFESLSELKPRVIICEHNPSFPAHLDIYTRYIDDNKSSKFGCSVGALIRLAAQKGYSLVALTFCNAFFVRNDEIAPFSFFETSLEKIRLDDYVHYMITDYSGNHAIIAHKNTTVPFGLGKRTNEPLLGEVRTLNLPR